MTELTERERRIFDLLQDEKSREIFIARKRFADAGYTAATDTDLFFSYYEKPDGFDDMILKLTDSPYVIYGAGYRARKIISALKHMNKLDNCIEIWDKNKKLHGTYVENIQISAPKSGRGGKMHKPNQHSTYSWV